MGKMATEPSLSSLISVAVAVLLAFVLLIVGVTGVNAQTDNMYSPVWQDQTDWDSGFLTDNAVVNDNKLTIIAAGSYIENARNEGDTYTESGGLRGNPNSNHGTDTFMKISRNTDGRDTQFEGFLLFDFSSFPDGVTIDSATLNLYCTSSSAGVRAYEVEDTTWNENVITYNNGYPSSGDAIDTSSSVTGWRNWTVTSWVENRYSVNKKASFKLRDTNPGGGTSSGAWFNTKESNEYRPHLEIAYTVPSTSSDGTHTTGWHNFGENVVLDNFNANTTINVGETVIVNVQTSDDGSIVKDNILIVLENGINNYDISSLSTAQYIRIESFLSTDNNSHVPVIHSYNVDAIPLPIITDVHVNRSLIDRDIDQPKSGAVDKVSISVRAEHKWGNNYLENAYFWIRNALDEEVATAEVDSSNSVAGDNWREWAYVYKPISLPDNALGIFDVKLKIVDDYLPKIQHGQGYKGLGNSLFTVNDLDVTLNIDDNTPIHELATLGTVSRVYGSVNVDNVVIKDNNEGSIFATFTDNAYSRNYELVSPIRLHHGDLGRVYVWARDNTLDGISPTLSYRVEGDNADVTILGITNEVDQSVIDVKLKWLSDDSYADGTVYVKYREEFRSHISGTGQLVIPHENWISSGPSKVTLFDNADRPLWRAITDTFETDSIFFDNIYLIGDQDNVRIKVKTYYTDGTVPSLMSTNLKVANEIQEKKVPDGNGYIEWKNIDLPDNRQNIRFKFDNVLDERSDEVVNCRLLEDVAIYTENTTIDLIVDDNEPTVYYGTTGSFTGTLVSQANYIELKVQENLYHENGDLIDNTPVLILTPGESVRYSLSDNSLQIAEYQLRLYSSNGTLIQSSPVRLWVKLSQPVSASPAQLWGTDDDNVIVAWKNVSGSENYTLQWSTHKNFLTYQEKVITNSSHLIDDLAENKYYWRVRANCENVLSADWFLRSFWVDNTPPSLDDFDGPSSTSSRTVTLTLNVSDKLGEVSHARFKEGSGSWGSWLSYSESMDFSISSGSGTRTVYAQVKDYAGNVSGILSTNISYTAPSSPSEPDLVPTSPLDTVPPTMLVLTSIPEVLNQSTLTIRVSATDDSGIASITTKLDNYDVPYTFVNGVITVGLYNLEEGMHNVVFVATDEQINVSTQEISFFVDLPPEPLVENIEMENLEGENVPPIAGIRQYVENVEAGENIQFAFPATVTSITFKPFEDLERLTVSFIKIENEPPIKNMDNAELSYSYFQIGVSGPSENIGEWNLEFRVSKAWMEEENVVDVRLYRLEDGENEWERLPIRFAREDFEYRYYETQLTRFSTFALMGIKQTVISHVAPITVLKGDKGIRPIHLAMGIALIAGAFALFFMRWRLRSKEKVKELERSIRGIKGRLRQERRDREKLKEDLEARKEILRKRRKRKK